MSSNTLATVLIPANEFAVVVNSIKPEGFNALVCSRRGQLRFGEVTELRRDDTGQGCESISVSRVVSPVAADSTVVLPPHIRIDAKLRVDITLAELDPEALLFVSPGRYGHTAHNEFRDALNTACQSIDRTGVSAHTLRRFGATMATRAGGNLAEVQARLGHSRVRAAMLCLHAAGGRDGEIAIALSTLAAMRTHNHSSDALVSDKRHHGVMTNTSISDRNDTAGARLSTSAGLTREQT